METQQPDSAAPLVAEVVRATPEVLVLKMPETGTKQSIGKHLPTTFTLVPKQAQPGQDFFLWDQNVTMTPAEQGMVTVHLNAPTVEQLSFRTKMPVGTQKIDLKGLARHFEKGGDFATNKPAGTALFYHKGKAHFIVVDIETVQVGKDNKVTLRLLPVKKMKAEGQKGAPHKDKDLMGGGEALAQLARAGEPLEQLILFVDASTVGGFWG